MKRVLMILCASLLIFLLAVPAGAAAYNPAGTCSIVATVKEAEPDSVIKDGVIGDGEYTEIEIDRCVDTTDCLLGWDNPNGVFEDSEKFLERVHFYMSWDRVHGLNVAVKAQLVEDTPSNLCYQPDDTYGGWGFPGDEFLFQFGTAFSIVEDTGETDNRGDRVFEEIIQRGISKNTETGELLIGHYGEWGYGLRHIKTNVNGYTGALTLAGGKDYNVGIDGNTVTYEISFPLQNIMPAEKYNGSEPVDGASVFFNLSTTGGSTGLFHSLGGKTSTYGVALGDFGMFLSKAGCETLSPATAVFSLEKVTGDTPADHGNDDGENNGDEGNTSGEDGDGNPASEGTENGEYNVGDGADKGAKKSENNGNGGDTPAGKNANGGYADGQASAKTGDGLCGYALMLITSASAALSAVRRKKNR